MHIYLFHPPHPLTTHIHLLHPPHTQDKESLVGEQSRMVALTDELGKELQQARLEATEEKKRSQNLITELEVN